MFYYFRFSEVHVLPFARRKTKRRMKYASLKLINNRKGDGSECHPTAVELRVTYDRKVRYLSTGLRVTPDEWEEGRVVGRPDAMLWNERITRQYADVSRVLRDMEAEGFVNIYAIEERLRLHSGKSFWEYVEERMAEKRVREGTRKRYPVFLNKIREYKMFRYFEDINERTVRRFDERLHAEGYAQNTVHGYHKHLKQFINDAICDGYMERNVYQTRRIHIERGRPAVGNYLTGDELSAMRSAAMPGKVSRVRDVFVFACYTGLSFCDLSAFSRDDVTEECGQRVVRGRRIKTGEEFVFLLLPEALEILERWEWRLPVPSAQKYNDYLKVAAQYAGIDKPLTSHWARHTAAMLMLNGGVPMEVVSRVLGHSSVRTTQQTYARVLDGTVIREMSKLR